MFLVKRIITILSGFIGGALGIIFLAFINWVFSLSITQGQVFVYGVVGGAVLGIVTSYLITIYLVRKAKRFVQGKFGGDSNRLTILKRV